MKFTKAVLVVFLMWSGSVHAGPWPTDNVVTTNLDSPTDSPSAARGDIYNALQRIKDIIGARNSASGVAPLDASSLVPLANIPATMTGKSADMVDGYHVGNAASQVLLLDGSGLVPLANIPATMTGKSADTLDGINSTQFARVDAASSFVQTVTFQGTVVNSKSCYALDGYNHYRIDSNFCLNTSSYTLPYSLSPNTCMPVYVSGVTPTRVAIKVQVGASSANAAGNRFTYVSGYADSACTVGIDGVYADAREFSAVTAGTVLARASGVMILPVTGGITYIKMTRDAGNQGFAAYGFAGYYD